MIVIVVIGILAAITIVAYSGIQDRATASREISDIQSLDKAIQLYYIDNGSYPTTGGVWAGWSQDVNFIPGLTPKYIAKEPQQVNTSNSQTTYLYLSDGVNYKLLSHQGTAAGAKTCATAVSMVPNMADSTRNCWAFGTWTPGAAGW